MGCTRNLILSTRMHKKENTTSYQTQYVHQKRVMCLGVMTFLLTSEMNPGNCYLRPFLCLLHHKTELVFMRVES